MSRLIGKDPDAGKDWRQEKGRTEDKMVGWHHWLNGHEFEQAWGDGEGQGSLACCSPLGHKELDRTSLVAQMVKASGYNVGDLGSIPGQEDTLEKETATHSSTLAWKISWTEEPGGLQSMGSQRVGHDWATSLQTAEQLFYTDYLSSIDYLLEAKESIHCTILFNLKNNPMN